MRSELIVQDPGEYFLTISEEFPDKGSSTKFEISTKRAGSKGFFLLGWLLFGPPILLIMFTGEFIGPAKNYLKIIAAKDTSINGGVRFLFGMLLMLFVYLWYVNGTAMGFVGFTDYHYAPSELFFGKDKGVIYHGW